MKAGWIATGKHGRDLMSISGRYNDGRSKGSPAIPLPVSSAQNTPSTSPMMMICQMAFKMKNQDRYVASGWSQVAQGGGWEDSVEVRGRPRLLLQLRGADEANNITDSFIRENVTSHSCDILLNATMMIFGSISSPVYLMKAFLCKFYLCVVYVNSTLHFFQISSII